MRLSQVRLGKVSVAVKTFGVCDFSRLAVTDWRLRRWRLWFLALMTATRLCVLGSGVRVRRLESSVLPSSEARR